MGVLLFNIDTRSVVLVEQFKLPSLIGRRRDDPATQDGWITEVMAGMIGPGETAEHAAIRETEEKTGYVIENPELICKFLSSPGGTSERIFLYFAKVTDSRRPGKGKTGVGDEDILDVGESGAAVPARAPDRRGGMRGFVRAGLRIRKVDQPVLGEVRMQRDVHEAAETHRADLRQRTQRGGIEHAFANHAQAAGALGHEHVAAGDESERPGMIQTFGDYRHVHAAELGIEIPGAFAERVDLILQDWRPAAESDRCLRCGGPLQLKLVEAREDQA